MLIFKKKIQ